MIRISKEGIHYYDRNGKEITDGCTIRYPSGVEKKVYLTENDELGTDATNPAWIESGRAFECEYGIYPFGSNETDEVEVVQ